MESYVDFVVLVAAFAAWVVFLASWAAPWLGLGLVVLFACAGVIVVRIYLFFAEQPPRFRTPPPPRPLPQPTPVDTGVLDYEPKA